jgi:sarcosine oxidase subunit beta
MTPDGFPIVGRVKEFPNFINAVGMCGQGFMLGPGLGEVISRIVTDELTKEDQKALQSFDPYRDFSGMEQFK